MSLQIIPINNPETIYFRWCDVFLLWQNSKDQKLLDLLKSIRENGFFLTFKSLRMKCWHATILNQVVILDGRSHIRSPIIKCFEENNNNISFDIILEKQYPYFINRIEIDIIEELGNSASALCDLHNITEIADEVGVPLHITDSAEITSMVPCTLINLLNNRNARTFPQKNGFKRTSAIDQSTRSEIAFFRFQHQNQLIHFINDKGRVNKDRLGELCEFFKNNLPDNLKKCILKLTLKEYVRTPIAMKKKTLNDF